MCYWHKDRHIDQLNKTGGLEINLFLWAIDFQQGCQGYSMGERVMFPRNTARQTVYSHVKILPHVSLKY